MFQAMLIDWLSAFSVKQTLCVVLRQIRRDRISCQLDRSLRKRLEVSNNLPGKRDRTCGYGIGRIGL